MKKELPQPSNKRIGEAISKHLAPAYLEKLLKQDKPAKGA